MRLSIKNYLEDVLLDFPRTNEHIQHRLAELNYIQSPIDNSKSSKEQRLLMTIAADKRLTLLALNQRSVQFCLDHSDSLTREIIQRLYFVSRPSQTLTGVGMSLHVDKATVSKRRKKFFELLAVELGLIDGNSKNP